MGPVVLHTQREQQKKFDPKDQRSSRNVFVVNIYRTFHVTQRSTVSIVEGLACILLAVLVALCALQILILLHVYGAGQRRPVSYLAGREFYRDLDRNYRKNLC
jgi:hypothetical protein